MPLLKLTVSHKTIALGGSSPDAHSACQQHLAQIRHSLVGTLHPCLAIEHRGQHSSIGATPRLRFRHITVRKAAISMKTATVTGATGFVGSELVRQLLDRGYRVKATCRCAPDSPRLAPLMHAADGAPGSLEFVQVGA